MDKQNKGAKAHEMPNTRGSGKGMAPKAGEEATNFVGTYVHAEPRAGVTRPHDDHAGSHDSLVREHGDHDIEEDDDE